jgi:hypothetical protein
MTDVIDDVRSFWKWVEQDAQQILRQTIPGLELDVSNLLIGGESAGGYHTAQTALLGMTKLPIKVLFIQYPGIDLESLFEPTENVETGPSHTPVVPYSVVEEHLAALEPGKICTRAKFGTRMDLHYAMIQAHKFCDISGERAWINPMRSLETAPKLPPILLYHSQEDEAVCIAIFVLLRLELTQRRCRTNIRKHGQKSCKGFSQMYRSISAGRLVTMFSTRTITRFTMSSIGTITWKHRG